MAIIKLILRIGGFKWIVETDNDHGFRIFGINVIHYKGGFVIDREPARPLRKWES